MAEDEYMERKEQLCAALENVAGELTIRTAVYALVETDDPGWPFDIQWVCMQGALSPAMDLINQRLFDTAFLDYGFHEVYDEDHIVGVPYLDIIDALSEPDAIAAAEYGFFDVGDSRARMARTMDEADEEEDPDSMRFAYFLQAVKGSVVEGKPARQLGYEDIPKVCGLIFCYGATGESAEGVKAGTFPIVAFQRIQPMWRLKTSSFLLYGMDGGFEAFSDRSLRVGTSFDFVLFDGCACFANLKVLSTLFCYRKLLARQARDYADTLDPILADFEKLDERIDASASVANKLLKIQKSKSPVVELPAEELAYRVRRNGYYSTKIHFNEEDKVMLTSNIQVSDFLKLLDDTLLVSPLTEARYEAKSKKRLDDSHATTAEVAQDEWQNTADGYEGAFDTAGAWQDDTSLYKEPFSDDDIPWDDETAQSGEE